MPQSRRRVLVLDDDADLRATLEAVFLSLGAEQCLTFGTLASLERSPEALNTDLALIDVNLGAGEPTGVDALNWLQGHGYHGKIVFLTGHAHSFPPVASAEKQALAQILKKPTSMETLASLLAS